MLTEELREKLMDYFGMAAFSGFPAAFGDLAEIENADRDELIEIARRLGIDVNNT